MTPELKSQVEGLGLAVLTAAGCIAYEKIVKASRLSSILFISLLFYLPAFVWLAWRDWVGTANEMRRIWTDPSLRWWSATYLVTWLTTPLWFMITKEQSVLAGSLYEVKYIVILAVFYFFIGQQRLSINLAVACVCALASIYFISRS